MHNIYICVYIYLYVCIEMKFIILLNVIVIYMFLMKWGQFEMMINSLSSAIPQEDQITGRSNITITKSFIGLLFDFKFFHRITSWKLD